MKRSVKASWEKRVDKALEDGLFLLYCQPILDLLNNRVSQYELLLRIVGVRCRIISPRPFLSSAERLGLSRPIDRWVAYRAINLIANHRMMNHSLRLHVNLSSNALADRRLLSMVQHELDVAEIKPESLVLEITEASAFADIGQLQRFIYAVKDIGCQVATDDFGDGSFSFRQLQQLPLDYLKTDIHLLRSLLSSSTNPHLIEPIVAMAHGFSCRIIVEGIEDAEPSAQSF